MSANGRRERARRGLGNHPERWEAVDGALGEESSFHQTFHFWIQGIETTTADLAPGWEGRCIQVQNANTNQMTGWCLEGHDLALAKLSAWRDKDKELVTILLAEGLVEGQRLLELLEDLPVDEAKRELIRTWIAVTMDDLAS